MIIIPSIEVKEKEKERALQPAKLSLLIWTVKKYFWMKHLRLWQSMHLFFVQNKKGDGYQQTQKF